VTNTDTYLDRDGLLSLGLDEHFIDRMLSETPYTGHGGQPVVESKRLSEYLEMFRLEGGVR
jgi:hypothetical protein